MKYLATVLILTFLILSSNYSFCQKKDSLQLRDLAMPVSPAFSLLDQTPTIIDRPTTAKALSLNIFQTFDQKTGLPSNYAAEFTPYWFVKHPNMSIYKFYGTNDDGQRQWTPPQPLRINFSMAFVNPAQPTSSVKTESITSSFSYGGRMPIIRINRKKDLEEFRKGIAGVVEGLKYINIIMPDIALSIFDSTEYQKQVKAALENKENLEKYESTKVDLSKILSRKPLFSSDLAFASNLFFPDKTFSSNRVGRTAVWLNLNLAGQFKNVGPSSGEKAYLSIYLIGRQMWDKSIIDTTTTGKYLVLQYSDLGGKLEFELNKFVLSYELVSRTVTGKDQEKNPFVGDGWRSVGNLRYRIGADTYITGAFGKNFGKRENLLYTFGINWNISTGNEQISYPQ